MPEWGSVFNLSRKIVASNAWLVTLLVCASLSHADGQAYRQPLGVYAKVDIEDLIKGYQGSQPVHVYLRHLYGLALADPAISGLTVGRHWDNIQLSDSRCIFSHSCAPGSEEGYDWSYLDDAFEEANSVHKSVQLIITPGFDSPPWLVHKIPPCDGLFPGSAPAPTSENAPSDCGTVRFTDFPEDQRSDKIDGHYVLPLPWNQAYQTAWWDFLTHLDARYKDNPAFISIAMAEPVGGSTEFILPTSERGDGTGHGKAMHPPLGPLADPTWAALIQHSFPNISDYQSTDQVFIDQWEQTIDAYEMIFAGVTLFLSPDSGSDLPWFKWNATLPMHPDNTLFAQDCSQAINSPLPYVDTDYRSCEAKTEILSYFVTVDGPNAKATQVGGMTATSATCTGDIALPGVKLLTSLSPPFLGGAEFDHPVSGTKTQRQEVGCPPLPGPICTVSPVKQAPNCDVTPEEAAYYVLANFFYGTPVAAYYGGKPGTAPMEYLEVAIEDVRYAQQNLCPPKSSKTLGKTSLEDLLNRTSHDLFEMAGQPKLLPAPTCLQP
jgi:hypothetical protein